MKTMKKIMAVMVLGLVLAGCSNTDDSGKKTEDTKAKTEQTTKAKDNNEETVTIKLLVDDKEKANKKVSFEEGQTLGEVMNENFEVADDNGMISSIDGNEQNVDENKYWLFDVNGEAATVSAGDLELKAGDEVVWKLNKLEMK
ncbi:DUF4430 domain-containing protein [Vagococcus fessus]|uniref:Transcobalamin-like C-terminal domain-containing protein n=1 Tax=Vagococcus fessus TaxID=120370 RepID=A0A430AC66_9ENTE|nr:DUF4430 domain-containing protein [Vagococcus fessus]RSU04812.1 hypothetical protein CBF31_01990 [Vagococcus fessus]